ncbi:hypothetical protein [Kangiella sediminilitoris]|uniref:Uncharacterized protein n=1 Tax=Kangiella sediminilitoris TaxID=1144748 RepID=A0A1B3BCX5_9GAMM|nr:hypothetical protein [Kangiella sediminilitoris]AOE50640.1 hypothetical protein KS2013_1931 [Kangiella sediminilitoris]
MRNTDKPLIVQNKVTSGSWGKTRDLLLLQVKLWCDAVRDFALMPVALICYILDLKSNSEDRVYWERLMKWGRRSDEHINLFHHDSFEQKKTVTVDDVADIVEDVLKSGVKGSTNTQQVVETVKQQIRARFGKE